nr:PREDICTED: uncharacterized protein LOC103996161 isoform X1 [Musa acuminata subsp. malaccensis]
MLVLRHQCRLLSAAFALLLFAAAALDSYSKPCLGDILLNPFCLIKLPLGDNFTLFALLRRHTPFLCSKADGLYSWESIRKWKKGGWDHRNKSTGSDSSALARPLHRAAPGAAGASPASPCAS